MKKIIITEAQLHIMRRVLKENSIVVSKSQTDEDTTKFIAKSNGKVIGNLSIVQYLSAYSYFEDDFSEDDYYEMFPDDQFIILEHLEVDKPFRGKGIAKQLVIAGINESKKLGYNRIYLNASPMGGLNLYDLIGFYKSFGFEEVLHQGNNCQMLLKL